MSMLTSAFSAATNANVVKIIEESFGGSMDLMPAFNLRTSTKDSELVGAISGFGAMQIGRAHV